MTTFSVRWRHSRAINSCIVSDPRYTPYRKPARTYWITGIMFVLLGLFFMHLSVTGLGALYTLVGIAVMMVTERWSFWVKTEVLMSQISDEKEIPRLEEFE
ncbi:MAG: hypothetical protein PHF83_06860 [Candidatus Methanomethylophilus sp.]|nr:hypothetical protein [Methanomethylophilus sp.]